MTTESIRVDSSVLQKALAQKPNYLNKTAFLSQLIEKAVDREVTLKSDPGAFIYSSRNNSSKEEFRNKDVPLSEYFTCHSKEHKAFLEDQKSALKKDSPAFQTFWEVYQAAPDRAKNQSKSKAREAWKGALKKETPENLIEAAKTAVKDQVRMIAADKWVAPFPDAHRWLRDECFTLWLEAITPKQAERIVPGVTVL